ncbi:NuoM family protein [Candidatus Eisenbacteria bacterium]|uniref:NuoM family protein n=1 Tax=Eiseniibacteriota bacterium TaxID=2212470 RepID=A0ABV6YJ95_UNCEI
MEFPILPAIMLSPALGAIVILFLPAHRHETIRWVAAAATGIALLLTLSLPFRYDSQIAGFQFITKISWIERLGISYHVGADGISISMLLLTAAVIVTGVFVSWSIKEMVKEHYMLLLLLVTGVFGVFMTLDLLFFYLFYELSVAPMYLLISVYGSHTKAYTKEYAAMKLTLYLTLGALFALVGLLILYATAGEATGVYTSDLLQLMAFGFTPRMQIMIFPLIFLGFGVIVPMWPLHTWSPIGHAAAPASVSMLHAGVLMKLGAFAIIRIGLSILPIGAAKWLPIVAYLCMFNIIYGGYVAMNQKDIKFIIGYSSSSHMGYVLLGLAGMSVVSLSGAVFMMFAHGIMTALLFGLIGFFYDQTHTRMVDELGGLAKQIPFLGVAFIIGALASSGLPGTANFVAELMVIVGAWKSYPIPTIAAAFGIVITATYMLRTVAKVFFGPMDAKWETLRDPLLVRERFPYVFLILILLAFGFAPGLLVDLIETAVTPVVEGLKAASAEARVFHIF